MTGQFTAYAESLTYKDAIRDAMNYSARIRVKVEDINISDAACRQNFAGLYPEISANSRLERYENLDRRGRPGFNTISGEIVGGDVSSWRSSAYLSGHYYLSHLYKKRYETTYYEKIKEVRAHECDIETKKLLRELTDLFNSLAEVRIKYDYTSDILNRLRGVRDLKREAFAKGQASYEDVLRVEADVAVTEKELASITKEFKENLERLHSYTGKTYSEDVRIEMLDSAGVKPVAEVAQLIEGSPEYKARMKELEAAKFKEKAAANNFWPDISLYGRYDYYGSNVNSLDSSLRDIRETSYQAGILISLPIFDGGIRKWERKKNLYEIRKQEESLKQSIQEKGRDIKTVSAGYVELSRALKHYRRLSDQYEKMLDIAKKAQSLGERSIMNIMEMEKEALAVERDLKVTEQTIAAYEKRLALEMDFSHFMTEHYGDGACKY
jgi:outer membrane protein TolC